MAGYNTRFPAAAAVALSLTSVAHAAVVTCGGPDGRAHVCFMDTSGGVLLQRQLSAAPCVKGRTWDAVPKGIWVQEGCAATFVVGEGSTPRQGSSVGAGIIGGIVGALLTSAISPHSSRTRIDPYYTRPITDPSDPRIPDEPGYVTRQRARDIADQRQDEQQRAAYAANQQAQRDAQDRADDDRQRADFQANQDFQRQVAERRADENAAREASEQDKSSSSDDSDSSDDKAAAEETPQF